MTRSLPLLAILLFLLLLNLVHTLDNHSNRNQKTNSLPTPILIAREDYSSFNQTRAPIDHHSKKTSREISEPTNSTASVSQPSVTTIIIIQSNGQTYRELGGGPSSTNGGDGSSAAGMNDPNESSFEAQENHEDEVLKRMISISTVVGGVGVVMIIAGTFIFIRLRAKRRQLKALNQLSTTPHSRNSHDNDDNNHTHHGRHRRHFSSASDGTHISHHHRQSPGSPTSVPVSTPNSPTTISDGYPHHEAIEMSTLHPSAPPEPTILPLHLRERRQQSLLSQQQMPSVTLTPISTSSSTTPAPSAPSAKELEMNLPATSSSSSTNPTTTHSSPIIKVSSPTSPTIEQNSHVDTNYSPMLLQSTSAAGQSSSSSSSASSTTTSMPGPSLHLKPTAGSDGSDPSTTSDQHHRPPLTPPPAYTPSAPPLFMLPPSQRRRSADQLSLDKYRRYQ